MLAVLTACAPVAPAPPGPAAVSSAPKPAIVEAPTVDVRAAEAAARRNARELLWAKIALRPELIPGDLPFAASGPDARPALSGIGCRFSIANDDVVEVSSGARA